MKVLLLLSSNERRGAEIKGTQLAGALRQAGNEVDVRCLADGIHGPLLDVDALGKRRLGLSTLRRLRKVAGTADIVIAYGSTTLPASAIALLWSDTPFVYRSIGDPEQWIRGRIHRIRTALLLRRSERVVALWPAAAEASRRIAGLDPWRVAAIPNAMSSDTTHRPTAAERLAARSDFGYTADVRIAAVVGALAPEKRVDLAIRAVGQIPDLHLLVAGDGLERSVLEGLGHEILEGRIRFLGSVADVTRVYAAADVVLLTSSTEGMPGVILEAGLAQRPVVATDVGAVSWMSEQGVGDITVVDRGASPGEIAAAIRGAIARPISRAPQSPGVPSWQTVAREWSDLLRDAVETNSRRKSLERDRIRVLAIMDSTAGGGAELSMAALVPALRRHDVDVDVAFFHDRPGARERLIADNTTLYHVPPGRTRLHTVVRLRRLIAWRRPDVVHTMVFEANILGRSAAALSGVPVVSSIISDVYRPSYFAAAPSPVRARAAQVVDGVTALLVCRFHAVSEVAAAAGAQQLHIPRAKIDVIHRGRDMRQLTRASPSENLRHSLGVGSHDKLLLAVGRHEPPKGLETAIRAMARVSVDVEDVKLLVAGRNGSSTQLLLDEIDRLGLASCVSLLGHRQDVAALMRECDLLIHPSRWEGLPGTIIEATALGTPIVCTDVPAVREVIHVSGADSSTTFVPIDDPDALADGILKALSEPLPNPYASVARSREAFDLDSTASAHADQYRQALRESRWIRSLQ